MVGSVVEMRAMTNAEIDVWMQRRIRYFGQPGLTTQEYRAVVYSLLGLPEVALKDGQVETEMELPTQRYVAVKMRITAGRVSQLLASASRALTWFELEGVTGIGWQRQGRTWHFAAPILDVPEQRQHRAEVRVVQDRVSRSYKLAFAGEL